MNRVFFIFLLCLFFTSSSAQDNLSVSLFGGTSQYLGDINKTNPVYKAAPSYGVGVIARKNLRFSWSFLFSYNSLKGSVNDFEDFVYPDVEPYKTGNSFNARVVDLAVNMEFDFLPYETYNIRKRNFTPFVFAGLGSNYFLSGEENQFPLIIPFGLGIKYNIFERFSIGMKWTAKKTFFDSMDGIVNINDSGNGSLMHNNDWYHHTVVFISYCPFRDKIDCPAYGD
jgi:hypothetical protein